MGPTRQRKVIATVMALAACALVIDKVFLNGAGSGPDEAGAGELPPAELATTSKGERPAKFESVNTRTHAWAANLLERARTRHALSVSGIGDGFAMPAALLPAAAPAPAPVAGAASPAPTAPQRDWKLVKVTAVIVTGGQEGAIIDGRFVRLGDEVHGMKLVRVLQTGVTLQDQAQQVELRLPGTNLDEHGRVTVRKPGTNNP